MVFSSPVFLFLFLPVVLTVYVLTPRVLKNAFLLFSSLVFYAWGESFFVLVMCASIAFNYAFGLLLSRARRRSLSARLTLAVAVLLNLGLLGVFKYANFLLENLVPIFARVGLDISLPEPIHLPIGISFFTFQAMTYVIDVYRGTARAQRNPIHVATYIALFPQLIAGPIVRYADIAGQLISRRVTWDRFSLGVNRFVLGLGKKILIADTLAVPADIVFGTPAAELTASIAWLGVFYYALQIYFDFSGYSDMAIGLGHMLGFRFGENFNYPYVARSMRDFWRRWHISLSTWFRDYLYVPMGGSRRGSGRTYFNLFCVFFLCGLWHGASWSFVAWGLIHGFFLVLERMMPRRPVQLYSVVLQHFYVLFVLLVTWVFFRTQTLSEAFSFLRAMAGLAPTPHPPLDLSRYVSVDLILAAAVGVLACAPLCRNANALLSGRIFRMHAFPRACLTWGRWSVTVVFLGTVLLACGMKLAAETYSPFIYFRF
jgi:alginate O-acetyltransferase complex protein AlgI